MVPVAAPAMPVVCSSLTWHAAPIERGVPRAGDPAPCNDLIAGMAPARGPTKRAANCYYAPNYTCDVLGVQAANTVTRPSRRVLPGTEPSRRPLDTSAMPAARLIYDPQVLLPRSHNSSMLLAGGGTNRSGMIYGPKIQTEVVSCICHVNKAKAW